MSVSIHIRSLTFGYRGTRPIFVDLDTSVIPSPAVPRRGFVSVVMGPSGHGKTTLLRLILGEERPQRGGVEIEPPESRISYLSQDAVLFEHMSLMDNARYFSKIRSMREHFDEAVFQRAVRELRLSEILERRSSIMDLSGGERQRLALLRAVSIRPSLLLFDEPCRGLDAPVRQEFLLYLRLLTDELGLSVVYVTHQQHEARMLADRLLFLFRPVPNGAARLSAGSLDEVLHRPPHEIIALTFAQGPMNRLSATVAGNSLVLQARQYVFDGDLHDIERTAEGTVLFSAAQIRWNTAAGIPCRETGRAGQYSVAVADGRGEAILGPACPDDIRTFDVEGEVLVFAKDGTLMRRGRIKPSSRSAALGPNPAEE